MWFSEEQDEFPADLAESTASTIAENGYCVIKVAKESNDENAAQKLMDQCTFGALTSQLAAGYLGHDGCSKIAWLDASDPGQEAPPIDFDLSRVGEAIMPLAPSYLSCEIWERSPGMVQMPLTESEEDTLAMSTQPDQWGEGFSEEYLDFCWRKKLLLMYIVDDAGKILLGPNEVPIALKPGKLILIRADMSYKWRPSSSQSMIMQCWLLGKPTVEMSNLFGEEIEMGVDVFDFDDVSLRKPRGPRSNFIGMKCRLPGRVSGGIDTFGIMTVTACDCSINHELAGRFGTTGNWFAGSPVVYGEDKGVMNVSYNHHGAFCDNDYIEMFDNSFFNLTEDETKVTYLEGKVFWENGYEALYSAGHTQKTLLGKDIGVFCGTNAGCSDIYGNWWSEAMKTSFMSDPALVERFLTSNAIGGFVAKFAYRFGLTGTTLGVDTACSASISSTALGNNELIENRTGAKKEALVGGVNVMSCLAIFATFCFLGALGRKGRSFTFDEHVDGYMRGEGCCQAVIRRSDQLTAEEDLALSFGTVMSALSGSDGKSASLTAPSGPAQQKIIRHSMECAGITVDECPGNECHGTGTPLGDPIEMGTVKGVWKKSKYAVGITSRKTYMGHTESNAGITGMCGCLLMLSKSIGIPNIHLRESSHLLDLDDMRGQFWTEVTDLACQDAYIGVCSFGIGGTNARADLWGRKADPNAYFLPKQVVSAPFQIAYAGEDTMQSHCIFGSDGRDQHGFSKMDYAQLLNEADRTALLDSHIYKNDRLYVVGTWDGYAVPVEMQAEGENRFTAVVELGDVQCEQFYIMVGPEGLEAEGQAEQLSSTTDIVAKSDAVAKEGTQDDMPALADVAETDAVDEEEGEMNEDLTDSLLGGVVHDLMDLGMDNHPGCFLCDQSADSVEVYSFYEDISQTTIFLKTSTASADQPSDGNPSMGDRTLHIADAADFVLSQHDINYYEGVDYLQCMAEDFYRQPAFAHPESRMSSTQSVDQIDDLQETEDATFDIIDASSAAPFSMNGMIDSLDFEDVLLRSTEGDSLDFQDFDLLGRFAQASHQQSTPDLRLDLVLDPDRKSKSKDNAVQATELSMERRAYSSTWNSMDTFAKQAPNSVRFIYPSGALSGVDVPMRGPIKDREQGHGWLLDGRGSETAFYSICLNISAQQKDISWTPHDETFSSFMAPFTHRYHIVGGCTRGRRFDLKPSGRAGCYEVTFHLDLNGEAEFQLLRDSDLQQAIFPAADPGKLWGPDVAFNGEQWHLTGRPDERVNFVLKVLKGKITITASMAVSGLQTWESA